MLSLSFEAQRKTVLKVWLTLLGAMAISMLLLSNAGMAAMLAIWMTAAATFTGAWILSIFRATPSGDIWDRIPLALPLGITAFASAAFVLGLANLLTPAAAWSILIAGTLPGITQFRSAPLPAVSHQNRESSFLLLLLAGAFVVNLMWAVAPEVQFDPLNYHLAVPRMYLDAGGIVELPYFFHSYFAHLADMLYTVCLALHTEILAKLMHAAVGLAAAAAVFSLGRMLFTPVVGLWAAAFFYTTPLVGWLSGTAYTDLFVALFVTALLLAVLQWTRSRHIGWMWIAGILAGASVAVKLNGAYAVAGAGMTLAVIVWRLHIPIISAIKTLGAFGVAALLVGAPWYALVYFETGNPVFPLLNGVFQSPRWAQDNTLMNAADFGIGTGVSALARLPFRMTFDTIRFGEALPRGALGPLLLLVVPFSLFLLWRTTREVRAVAGIGAVYFLCWAQSFQYARYYVAVLPIVAVFAVAGVHSLLRAPLAALLGRITLAVLLIVQFTVLSVLFWNIPERFPIQFAFGLESRESFLSRALHGYGGAAHINRNIAPGDRVLGIGTENLRYYLNAPLETLAGSPLRDVDVRRLVDVPPGPALVNRLAELRFPYLLVTYDALIAPSHEYPYLAPEFLREFATLVYADASTRVFRFHR